MNEQFRIVWFSPPCGRDGDEETAPAASKFPKLSVICHDAPQRHDISFTKADCETGMGRRKTTEPTLLLKGTRTALSFVAEARRLSISDPYPEAGQAGYSVMADVLARSVLFANWEVVGAAALIRAGDEVRVAEAGLLGPFRTDEFMRRLTYRMIADATHELDGIEHILDAFREPFEIASFVARRRTNRAEDKAARPTPIGRIEIPLDAQMAERLSEHDFRAADAMPRAPRSATL